MSVISVVPGRAYTASVVIDLSGADLSLTFFDKDGVEIGGQGTGEEKLEVERRGHHTIVRGKTTAAHDPAQNRKQRRAADARSRRK